MSEPNTPTATPPAQGGATPPEPPASPAAGATPPPTGEGATPPPAATPPAADPLGEAGLAALQRERDARAAVEAELRTMREAAEERRLSELGELEAAKERERAATARAEAAEATLRDAAVTTQLNAAAIAAGVNPDAIDLIVSVAAKQVTVNDQGVPEGIAEALTELQAKHPTLFGTPGTPPAAAPNLNAGAGSKHVPDVNYGLSQEQIAFCDANKIPYETYHKNLTRYDTP